MNDPNPCPVTSSTVIRLKFVDRSTLSIIEPDLPASIRSITDSIAALRLPRILATALSLLLQNARIMIPERLITKPLQSLFLLAAALIDLRLPPYLSPIATL
jgi:hypothetical protein